MIELNRKTDETINQYIWRLGSAKDAGLISYNWNELSAIMNRNIYSDEQDYLGESAYRKRYINARDMYEDVFSKNQTADSQNDILRSIECERKKLQTEKLEYNKWLRESARDDMIAEKICDAIKTLDPITIPNPIEPKYNNKSYLLVISDAHYGVEFDIKGLYGQSINSYSPDIFEYRMGILMSRVCEIIEQEQIDTINIWDLSDSIEGILRVSSQLMKLRYGVIESSIRYAEYLANWLTEISMMANVRFQMCLYGNHSELRLIGAPKGAFPEENMAKVILEFLKLRLKGNPNIEIIENPTGNCYDVYNGFTVLGFHGDGKSLGNMISDFQRTYDSPIDYSICGHKHHSASEEVGVCKEELVVRSIIGVDPYAVKLNRASNPGASMFMFEDRDGLTREYKINLREA